MVKLVSRLLWLIAALMTTVVAQTEASTIYDQVFTSPTTIKCNSDASCAILDHIRVQAVTYSSNAGSGVYTWTATCASAPDAVFYIRPTGATTGCFQMDGFMQSAVPGTVALPSANIPVGNASNVSVARPMTGDVALTNTGVTTVNTVNGGSTPVTTARTITAGTGLNGGGDLSANRTLSLNIAASVSALSALASPSTLGHVTVTGYYSGSIAGGGTFDYSTTGTVDGCTTFAASDGKYWIRQQTSTYLDVSQCGAKCDGVTDDRAAFVLADAAVATTKRSIYVSGGSCYIATSLTIASQVVFSQGGMVKPSAPAVITFNITPQAGDYQIFDSAAADNIHFGGPTTNAFPEWWGCVGDGVTDDTTCLQAFAYAIGEQSTTSGMGGYASMHRTYKTTAQVVFYYSGSPGKSLYLDASAGRICYNGTSTAVKVNTPSNTGGITIYGLMVDEQSSCSSGLTTGGFDFVTSISSTCIKCVVLVKSTNAAATWAGFTTEDNGTTGSYWAKLEDTIVSADTYVPTAYLIKNNDNAVQIIGAQCATVTTCVQLTGSNGDPNGVVIDRLFAEDIQSYMIHATTSSGVFTSGLRVTNYRLEPRNAITAFKFDGGTGPNYGGDPVSFYVSDGFNVVPSLGGNITLFDTPSGMIFSYNGTRMQRTDITASASAQIFTFAQASKTASGMAGTAGTLNCEFQSTGSTDANSITSSINATGQGTTNATRLTLQSIINGTNPITGFTPIADTHGTNMIAMQATAYATHAIQSMCSFNGVNNFTP